jgi:hypothetical protein
VIGEHDVLERACAGGFASVEHAGS